MRKTVLVLVILVATSTLVACQGSPCALAGPEAADSTFNSKVGGTPGLAFHGHYVLVTASGTPTSRRVKGTVPAEYSVRGSVVSLALRKQEESGTLQLEIITDVEVVARSHTSAAYGMVC